MPGAGGPVTARRGRRVVVVNHADAQGRVRHQTPAKGGLPTSRKTTQHQEQGLARGGYSCGYCLDMIVFFSYPARGGEEGRGEREEGEGRRKKEGKPECLSASVVLAPATGTASGSRRGWPPPAAGHCLPVASERNYSGAAGGLAAAGVGARKIPGKIQS